ncbi:PHP domain-containing protein [Egbenema bharatensis]|uniref:PHP domain-containing protein n=1 Tax=Egbenema bharatensis TaxID=3463334 RepID=UPI003A88F51E
MAVDLARSSVWSAAQDAKTLRSIFETIHAESCPRSFNFHIHTVCSDGRLQPEQVVKQAIEIGLQGFAITDHHSVNGYRKAQRYLENWIWSSFDTPQPKVAPTLWTGMEINAGLLGVDVHILAYAFDPAHKALCPYQRGATVSEQVYAAARVIEAVHEAGGIAILAHPARYRRSPFELIPEAARLGIDGVEAYYAYGNPFPWSPSLEQTAEVRGLAEAYGLLHTCGTDTHGMSLMQRI